VAWCIVPFDVKKRGPVERAEMLNKLGIRKFAYDWREEHIPTFDAEIDSLNAHHIQLTAWWLSIGDDPANNHDVATVLDLLRRRRIKTELWVRYVPDKDFDSLTQAEKVAKAAKAISYIAAEAQKIDCTVALYNHNKWYGEPENELAILEAVHASNVGLVYNFNHGQDQIDRFPIFYPKILPHLVALNLAGLREGDQHIFPIGQGGSELKMISIIWKSSYRGPIGIINENTDPDAERGLTVNMTGLEHILGEIGDNKALATYK
jgi:sugar phosphate isomerase/epimerase